ncbi:MULTISPECIES: LytR C-terminal domain-containing protein [unclassified Solwaraspora]|uniref:LytR C-terminal domain-containing protein n=1 Tax=unclassified Solwaraspora TaxID=2627926 RepID=UPI00259AEEF8|nr:LytR C-terminal domain-containing protein [Solwaraspora sp. WMMA2056]WJK44100.1 LytR C-terminal domain-containing protein [Solwaraspora sp. WMMA2056]
MRALVVVGVLVVFALIFVVVAMVRDSQSGDAATASCPAGWAVADVTLREAKDVRLNVFNATDTSGLATNVADDLGNRKFQIEEAANDPEGRRIDGVAVLRYGPKAVGSAHLMRAYFLDQATTEYDPAREDDIVDVVIGNAFRQLATTTEVNQSLAALGKPVLPPETCAAPQ